MEKIDITSSSSLAKLLGTMIAIFGAMVFTFYQDPEIFHTIISSDSPNQILLSKPSNWVFGGIIFVLAGLCASMWNVLQVRASDII